MMEHRAAVKLHAQLDLRGWLAAVQITPAKNPGCSVAGLLPVWSRGAFYLLDRGYVDYRRLHTIEQARAWFITRAQKTHEVIIALHSHPVGWNTGLRSDQTIMLRGHKVPATNILINSWRVRCRDCRETRSLIFLTNHFGLPAFDRDPAVPATLQQIELFFRWLKQHLQKRLRLFYGRSRKCCHAPSCGSHRAFMLWLPLPRSSTLEVRTHVSSKSSKSAQHQRFRQNPFKSTVCWPSRAKNIQTPLPNQVASL